MRVTTWATIALMPLLVPAGTQAQTVFYVGGSGFLGSVQTPAGSCPGATHSFAGAATDMILALDHLELGTSLQFGRPDGLCGPAAPLLRGWPPYQRYYDGWGEDLRVAVVTAGYTPTPHRGLLFRVGAGWRLASDVPVVTGGMAWRVQWARARVVGATDLSFIPARYLQAVEDSADGRIKHSQIPGETWLRFVALKLGVEYRLGKGGVAGQAILVRSLVDSAAVIAALGGPARVAARDTGSWTGWINWENHERRLDVTPVRYTVNPELGNAIQQVVRQTARREPYGRGAIISISLRDSIAVRAWEPAQLKPALLNKQLLSDSLELKAKREAITGRGAVRIRVDSRGYPDSLLIARTSRHAQLDSILLHVAEEARFSPGTIDKHAVPMWVDLPLAVRR